MSQHLISANIKFFAISVGECRRWAERDARVVNTPQLPCSSATRGASSSLRRRFRTRNVFPFCKTESCMRSVSSIRKDPEQGPFFARQTGNACRWSSCWSCCPRWCRSRRSCPRWCWSRRGWSCRNPCSAVIGKLRGSGIEHRCIAFIIYFL